MTNLGRFLRLVIMVSDHQASQQHEVAELNLSAEEEVPLVRSTREVEYKVRKVEEVEVDHELV